MQRHKYVLVFSNRMTSQKRSIGLGELVKTLIVESINFVHGQLEEDLPCKPKEEYNRELRARYRRVMMELVAEINGREKTYLKNQKTL